MQQKWRTSTFHRVSIRCWLFNAMHTTFAIPSDENVAVLQKLQKTNHLAQINIYHLPRQYPMIAVNVTAEQFDGRCRINVTFRLSKRTFPPGHKLYPRGITVPVRMSTVLPDIVLVTS